MPTNVTLDLFERNNDTIPLTITSTATGAAEDLTNLTIEVYIKTSADAADEDVSTVKLVSPTDVTITDATGGRCQFVVPDAVVAEPGTKFWRVDTVDASGDRITAGYGAVNIVNL